MEYSNNKLSKVRYYAHQSGILQSYFDYQYNTGKVVKKSYSANGTLTSVKTYKVNSNNDVVLYTAINYADGQKDIFDTIRYSYDVNNYMITMESESWYIFTNPIYNSHTSSLSSYTYPSPDVCTITTSHNSEPATARSNEYYTDLHPNPNSFLYSPYFLGKMDHLLIKKEYEQVFTYVLDNNQNVSEKRTSINNELILTEKYVYKCQP